MSDEKHYQSMIAKETFDMVPFKADNKYSATKSYKKVMESRDGLIKTTYTSTELIGVQEMKVFAVLILNCIGEARYKLSDTETKTKKRAYGLEFDIREASHKIKGATAERDRKSILESLRRLKKLDILIEKKSAAPEIDQTSKITDSQWVFEVEYTTEYEMAQVLVSRPLVNISNSDGIGYSLTALLGYKGRAAILYFFMQGYKMGDENIHGRYVYQSQVPHKRIVEALDLETLSPKMQNARIREAFRDIGLNFVKKGNYWVKTKKPAIRGKISA